MKKKLFALVLFISLAFFPAVFCEAAGSEKEVSVRDELTMTLPEGFVFLSTLSDSTSAYINNSTYDVLIVHAPDFVELNPIYQGFMDEIFAENAVLEPDLKSVEEKLNDMAISLGLIDDAVLISSGYTKVAGIPAKTVAFTGEFDTYHTTGKTAYFALPGSGTHYMVFFMMLSLNASNHEFKALDEFIASARLTEQEAQETSAPDDHPAEESLDGIHFREIPWYASVREAESVLLAYDADHKYTYSSSDIYRLSALEWSNITTGSDRVDDGGYRREYRNVPVAGYIPSGTYACYVYPVQDGKVVKSQEDAQFYLGWYTFKAGDFTDIDLLYNDLLDKLTAIYGEGKKEESEFFTTIDWYDDDNNHARLLMDEDVSYIALSYMADGAEERLDEVKEILEAEKNAQQSSKEAEDREKNKENYSGL